jgi:hypothetical protein
MVVKQPLWQQNDTTDQSADIVRLLVRDLVNERHGIIQETAFQATQRGAGANNSVDIQVGGIIIPGTQSGVQGYYYVVNDAVVNVPMSTAAHGSLPRIDTVIVRVRDSFYSGADNDAGLVYVAGTAASSPVAPTITDNNYYKLANINVPANDNTITTADITDVRTISPQGRAVVTGGIIACTSTTRPSNPRKGQAIWESNTRQLLINEGTSALPSWVVYAVPGSGAWVNYTPTVGGITGGSNTLYGRYFNMGSLVVGVCGFILGASGNITGPITITVPGAEPATTAGGSNVTYVCVGRAFDASANVYFSATGQLAPSFSTTVLFNFATAGTSGWTTNVPITWDPSDALNVLFAYETAV